MENKNIIIILLVIIVILAAAIGVMFLTSANAKEPTNIKITSIVLLVCGHKLKSVVEQFLNGNINYLGMIPQDAALERAVRQQKIVSISEPNSDSARAFEMLTKNLLEGTHHMAPMRRGIAQIFSQLLNHRK